jgi:CMP-N-acetylneuraminic acid synthetase
MCKTEVLLKSQTFAPERTLGYKMPKERSVDIDDIVDFKLAETILSEKNILSKI